MAWHGPCHPDWVAAICGLLLLSPVMLLIMIGVKITSRGSVLYRQVRVGHNNIPFMIYKFRSMKIDAERLGAQWATRNDPRVTLSGGFYDELISMKSPS